MIRKIFTKLNPTQIIVIGFLILNLIGTLLLMMPFSYADGKETSFTNALFTSTSALCVTGLSVVNTLEHWSLIGKCVILFLIQIGGIGFMTIVTSILVVLGKKVTLKERIVLQESFNLDTFQGMVSFAKKIILGTIFFEGTGAFLLSIKFVPKYGFASGIFKGIFHSISAFCNAGFDIFGSDSLISYSNDWYINIILALLIIIGGLGFIVWVDLLKVIKNSFGKKLPLRKKFQNLSLHSKLVLTISTTLIIFGWIYIFFSEYDNPATLGNMSFGEKTLASFFQSVTLRTAGFTTINQGDLTYASKLLGIAFMLIGGSSGSTAGGMKTVTIGVVIIAVISVIRAHDSISVFKKSISFNTLQKALTVVVMMIGFLLILTIALSFTEKGINYNYEFMDLFYEASSALGTVGLSVGLTPYLSIAGKIIICVGMFIGRLGPVTIAVALASKNNSVKNLLHYPEEKIFVG